MITRIDKETLLFMAKKRLSFNQLCICLLIYHQDIEGIIRYTHEIGYLGEGRLKRSKEIAAKLNSETDVMEIEDLVKRKFLRHIGVDKSEYYSLDNFVVTEKFTDGILLSGEVMAKEFLAAYPSYLLIRGEEISAKSVIFDEFLQAYLKAINHDPSEHKLALEVITEYTKYHKYAQMGIIKWVGSLQWKNINRDTRAKPRLY